MNKNKVLIIAEAGVNHNGDIKKAFQLIDAAVEAGANIIKFQTFKADEMILPNTRSTNYQIKNIKSNKSQYELLNSLELTNEMHLKITDYCKIKEIEFLSSAFSVKSLNYLIKLGIKRIKIPSGEITNLPYLEKAASLGLPIIISTGMSTLSEVKDACEILTSSGLKKEKLTLLHCTSNYPATLKSINLNAMNLMAEKLSIDIGYSDHSLSNETSIAAVALGATVIEKHITINKNLYGPDHLASLEPKEFKQLVSSIRKVEVIMGKRKKFPNSVEIKNALLVRKSIVAATKIRKGEIFSKKNLTTKRPGYGLSPMLWYKILGKKATKNYRIDELIEYEN